MNKLTIPIVLLNTLGLGACTTTPPDLPSDTELPLAAVVKAVQCEMQSAVRAATAGGRHGWLRQWEAAYELTLTVTETGGVKVAGGTAIFGSDLVGGFGGSFEGKQTRKRIAKLNFAVAVADIEKYICDETRPVRHPMLKGEIGFGQWLLRSLEAVEPSRPHDASTPLMRQPASLGHTFDFTASVNASFAPSITFLPAGGATLSPAIGADQSSAHILDVTFAASKAAPGAPAQKVLVSPSSDKIAELNRKIAAEEQALSRAIAERRELAPDAGADVGGPDVARKENERRQEAIRARLQRYRRELQPVVRVIPGTPPQSFVGREAEGALRSLQFERLLGR